MVLLIFTCFKHLSLKQIQLKSQIETKKTGKQYFSKSFYSMVKAMNLRVMIIKKKKKSQKSLFFSQKQHCQSLCRVSLLLAPSLSETLRRFSYKPFLSVPIRDKTTETKKITQLKREYVDSHERPPWASHLKLPRALGFLVYSL